MGMVRKFERNKAGKDYAVGDIHGCFTRLEGRLDAMGFRPDVDRLFCVGDLVDRGPESDHALEWLEKPWFHAVRGNHEQMAIDWASGTLDSYLYNANGGAWNIANPPAVRVEYAAAFSMMPIAMEVETVCGVVGIVHADCPVSDWQDLQEALFGPNAEAFQSQCLWSRDRINRQFGDDVTGVHAVIVGHTPVERMTILGNVLYIDTGAVFRGREFTILDLETLRPVAGSSRSLEWEA